MRGEDNSSKKFSCERCQRNGAEAERECGVKSGVCWPVSLPRPLLCSCSALGAGRVTLLHCIT